jgi:hypothetical protein
MQLQTPLPNFRVFWSRQLQSRRDVSLDARTLRPKVRLEREFSASRVMATKRLAAGRQQNRGRGERPVGVS